MRALPIVVAGVGVALAASATAMTALAGGRQASFAHREAALVQRWDANTAAGEPAASIAPLRRQLAGSTYATSPAWAPLWWVDTGQSLLNDLEARTTRAWAAVMGTARGQAAGVFTAWEQMAAEFSGYVPATALSAQRAWHGELEAAATPVSIQRLIGAWTGEITTARNAALLGQSNAAVASFGGVKGLLSQAGAAVARARRDLLDPGQVPALTTTLRAELSSHADDASTLRDLVAAVQTLHALLGLNDNVAAGLRPILESVDQAAAERVPISARILAQYNTIAQEFRAASVPSQIHAVAAQMVALQTTVANALSADQCGHAVPSGRVITLNLTLQETIFYQDGCVVRAAPITTGRIHLRTPAGTFHVFFKTSPFTMVSPWPRGSPFWYPTTTVTWVMEFDAGGYFLHDAAWEPSSMFGPGSENSYVASHGCVHIPTPVMQWAYQWTPIGTPVMITY